MVSLRESVGGWGLFKDVGKVFCDVCFGPGLEGRHRWNYDAGKARDMVVMNLGN